MTSTQNLYAQVSALFPPDGPHTPGTVLAASRAVAELVRYLNHATRSQDGFAEPSDLGNVIGEVETALERLPQLVRQLAGQADRFADTPGIMSDRMGEAGRECAGTVAAELHDALTPLDIARRAVESAREHASRLYVGESS